MIQGREGMLFHKLVEDISATYRVPPSTVRWNLSKLRDTKLIIAGDQNSKGIPVQLTEEAKFIISTAKTINSY